MMSFLRNLFGKKPAPSKKAPDADDPAADDIGAARADESPVEEITPDRSSPKDVVRYVFQQLATGKTRNRLQADLVQRGFHRKTAEEYIDLVEKTMFKGRT